MPTPDRASSLDAPIHLVLTDDWELRGNGSGNMRTIQFSTIRRLTAIYEAHGLRGSFNAEVMQQFGHRAWAAKYPLLGELADEWEQVVTDVYRAGHDVQLHLHPQWIGASYDGQRWTLPSQWGITEYSAEEIRDLLAKGKQYLESLIRRVNPAYSCVSFRSGSWSLAPSEHVLPALADAGIVFDMSIAEGLHYDLPIVKLDYRHIEEPFRPFFPQMHDARRVSNKPEPIVCVPTHTWRLTILFKGAHKIGAVVTRRLMPSFARKHFLTGVDTRIENSDYQADYGASVWASQPSALERIRSAFRNFRVFRVVDNSAMSSMQMHAALRGVRRRARGVAKPVPIIFENHTKDIGDFLPIERFCKTLQGASDVRVITLSELAQNLRAGLYDVRYDARAG
jgi:hypothetical protein